MEVTNDTKGCRQSIGQRLQGRVWLNELVVTQMYSWTHTPSLEILPCSPCSSHGRWFARGLGTESTAPDGSTGHPAGRRNDSSHTAMGSVCTTGPQLADTSDMGKGGPFLGTFPRSPWGSSSIFVPAKSRKVWRQKLVWSHFYLLFLLFRCFLSTHTGAPHTHTHIHMHCQPRPAAPLIRERGVSHVIPDYMSDQVQQTHTLQRGPDCFSALPHTQIRKQTHLVHAHTPVTC